jgi:microcystin-dependent protein
MSRARDASRLSNSSVFSVGPTNNVGVGSTTPDVKLDVQDGTIEAGSFVGPLTGNVTSNQINVGSAITISSSDNVANFGTNASIAANTGVVRATVFVGDGSGLTNFVGIGSGVSVASGGVPVGTAATINFTDNITVSQISAGICTVSAIADSSINYWPQTSAGIHTLSNVGVGTTNPTSTLTVRGSVNLIGITTISDLRVSNIVASGVGTFSTIQVGSAVTLRTSGIEAYNVNIDSGGLRVAGVATASSFVGNGTIPVGGIIMWSGLLAAIPTGWALCDGSNGTPDLRNRFVVGAAIDGIGNYSYDGTTGAVSGNYAPGNSGGEAAHRLTTGEMPAHTHSTERFQETGSGLRGGPSGTIYSNVASTSGSTGSNLYHENRPPYYALAFIIRTA